MPADAAVSPAETTAGAPAVHQSLEPLLVPVASLQPFHRNPRVGDVQAIVRSLREFGQYRPVVVNTRTQQILAGNHTFVAAQELGWESIAATFVDVDEDTAQRIVLADNRLSDLGRYDEEMLAEILGDLAQQDGAEVLGSVGYSEGDLSRLLAKQAPPEGFASYDEDLPTEYRCPRCAYEWSGQPR